VGMRIAIITESFPPDVNGVAHCVVRVADHLARIGHQPLVIAPESARPADPTYPPYPWARVPRGDDSHFPYPVERVPSVPLPGYPTFRVGLPGPRIRRAIVDHGAEVVHLASPVALGAWGSHVARALDLPTVAVYQTDLPAYARAYRLSKATEAFAWKWLRDIHNAAGRTLAPSSVTARDLTDHGMTNVRIWGRGVDTTRFHPARRDCALRAELAPNGEMLAGYVGRLATEKRVDLLAKIATLPGVRLVITGGGPEADAVRAAIPGALFLGEAALSWRGSTRAWTFSCTAARSRRSGRPSRRPPPAGCRLSPPTQAARLTSSRTASPATSSPPGTLTRWPARSRDWPPTRRCAPGWARRAAVRSSAAPGPRSRRSSSSTTRRSSPARDPHPSSRPECVSGENSMSQQCGRGDPR
jgi:hypothetical protein